MRSRLGAFALASVLAVGCSGGAGVPVAPNAVFESWDGEQAHARVALANREAVHTLLAFEPVLPRSLPGDLELPDALVVEPSAITNPSDRAVLTTVAYSFATPDGRWGLSLGEYLVHPSHGSPLMSDGARTEVVTGVEVLRHDRPPEAGFPNGLRRAAWEGCGVGFDLAGPVTDLTSADFDAVVASIIEVCAERGGSEPR